MGKLRKSGLYPFHVYYLDYQLAEGILKLLAVTTSSNDEAGLLHL